MRLHQPSTSRFGALLSQEVAKGYRGASSDRRVTLRETVLRENNRAWAVGPRGPDDVSSRGFSEATLDPKRATRTVYGLGVPQGSTQ